MNEAAITAGVPDVKLSLQIHQDSTGVQEILLHDAEEAQGWVKKLLPSLMGEGRYTLHYDDIYGGAVIDFSQVTRFTLERLPKGRWGTRDE